MQQLIKSGFVTSLELVEQINIFRKEERNRGSNDRLHADITHDSLLKIIREEFSEEIGVGELNDTPYFHPQNKQMYKMFEFTYNQAKQVLVRESKIVRKAVISYIEKLEQEVLNPKPKSSMELLADAVLLAQQVIAEKDNQIKELAPRAEYTDKVLKSSTTLTITEIAKDLGTTAIKLNEFLCEQKVQTKHRDHYVLLAKYQGKGYEKITTQLVVRNNEAFSKMQMEWTERGRAFIHYLYNNSLSFSKAPLLPVQSSLPLINFQNNS